jgi:uncharacterized membrane protein
MRLWLIPMTYMGGAVVSGFLLPRIEQAYLASYTFGLSVASIQAFLSAVASGMMALTAIVFAISIVMVQFSSSAYSPRLSIWFARDPTLFHSLGMFIATFIYSLATLAWVDRGGSGAVPLFSNILVLMLLVISMVLFSLLVQRLTNLQVTNVLQKAGDRGRQVIRDMFIRLDSTPSQEPVARIRPGPRTQTLKYVGVPRTIAEFDIGALTRHAQDASGTIVMACAVGDTVVENTTLLSVIGGSKALSEKRLLQAIEFAPDRTFEQDPKFAIRLLADIAIKALSSAINDPTTAVQAIDQIQDLLGRLGQRNLDAGRIRDANGVLRLVVPMPTWEDYLALAFDEIRQFGAGSVQVLRRLRSALADLADTLPHRDCAEAVQRYLDHLDLAIERSPFDAQDQAMARQEDRQGLGLAGKRGKTIEEATQIDGLAQ